MTDSWNSPQRDITPEPVVLSRRKWLKAAGWSAAVAATGGAAWWYFRPGTDSEIIDAGQYNWVANDLYPASPNLEFEAVDRPISNELAAARYCNFYEFSSFKSVYAHVANFQPVPWTVEVTGMVAHPRIFDIDTLVRSFPLEERVYRHRCVEAWAMVVPWIGFPLAELLRHVQPLPAARFVRFLSFNRPEEAPRQGHDGFPWPYTEGLTLAEATNVLTFLATGMYGHPLLKQHGAPVRLVVPWKYGFKSAKSIVRIELTDQQPETFWNTLQPNEYGFEANVDPTVPHPRWSQARERMLGSDEYRTTMIYNGYGQWMGHLYTK